MAVIYTGKPAGFNFGIWYDSDCKNLVFYLGWYAVGASSLSVAEFCERTNPEYSSAWHGWNFYINKNIYTRNKLQVNIQFYGHDFVCWIHNTYYKLKARIRNESR